MKGKKFVAILLVLMFVLSSSVYGDNFILRKFEKVPVRLEMSNFSVDFNQIFKKTVQLGYKRPGLFGGQWIEAKVLLKPIDRSYFIMVGYSIPLGDILRWMRK